MKTNVYTSFDDLPDGTRLMGESIALDRWFDSLAWFRCLYGTVLASSVQPRIYVVTTDAARVIACLFCCTRDGQSRELASIGNYYTMEFSPAFEPGTDVGAACAELATFIAAERPRWHSLRLDYLKTSNSATATLIEALGRAGFSVHRHHQYENWYLDCAQMSFEQYYSARPSRLRNTIERKGRKLEKSHQSRFILYRDPGDDLESGVRDYVTVYNASWKQPEPHPHFMPELARQLAARNLLRLGVLYVDGKPVAAQFWITTRTEACIYKLAYDEQFAEMSVGAILSREMFRLALDDDRVKRIDYGVGSEAYKREWMSATQEVFGVQAFSRRSLTGLSRAFLARLKANVKTLSGRIPRQHTRPES